MAKYHKPIYKTDSFCGGSNININHRTCRVRIAIKLVIQSYTLHWHHMYLLHPGMHKQR